MTRKVNNGRSPATVPDTLLLSVRKSDVTPCDVGSTRAPEFRKIIKDLEFDKDAEIKRLTELNAAKDRDIKKLVEAGKYKDGEVQKHRAKISTMSAQMDALRQSSRLSAEQLATAREQNAEVTAKYTALKKKKNNGSETKVARLEEAIRGATAKALMLECALNSKQSPGPVTKFPKRELGQQSSKKAAAEKQQLETIIQQKNAKLNNQAQELAELKAKDLEVSGRLETALRLEARYADMVEEGKWLQGRIGALLEFKRATLDGLEEQQRLSRELANDTKMAVRLLARIDTNALAQCTTSSTLHDQLKSLAVAGTKRVHTEVEPEPELKEKRKRKKTG